MAVKVQTPTAMRWRPVHSTVTIAASKGLTANETARQEGLSVETIKQYRKEAIALLGAYNMTHTVALAIRKGIIP